MKIKSLFIILIAQITFVCGVFGQEKIRVGVLNGPSCIPCVWITENPEFQFSKHADPQALLPKMIKGEVDVGFLPVNVAAKVYNSSNHKIILCAVTGNGNLRLITSQKNIKRISDLKNVRVNVAGQGATPEYMFKYLLQKNNVQIETKTGVRLDFSVPTAQIPAMLISGKIDNAVLPEPFATIACMKSKNLYTAVDFQNEYLYFSGKTDYPLTVMVVRSDYAYSHQNELENFLTAYAKASKETVKNPAETGRLCEKYNMGLTQAVVSASIPKSNYVFQTAAESIDKIESLLNIFIECDAASIGGKLPDSDFYYKTAN
ncbi:MAG: ABC transporter substrate-binding protein [Treponema sp.]|nr:ABC transporter substrate-binding protein [Treponema sp.]